MTLTLHARHDSALRCPSCHDSLTRTCAECGTTQHAECYEAHGCTTLGCKGSGRAAARERRRDTRPTPGSAPSAASPSWPRRVRNVLIAVAAVLVGGAVILPELIGHSCHRRGMESAAIGSLKTIATAQSLFREADKEQDEVFDYATLCELGETQLVDSVLASGRKYGYEFVCQPAANPEFTWWAMARPLDRDAEQRSFFANHEGVIYYSQPGRPPMCPCEVGPNGEPAASWTPIGQ
ncbi:MAG TPA: hypothetical protein DEA08_15780 [Planctomycetes bacterium]|nr:hypothetical protein [Planctomycetota bacterium]